MAHRECIKDESTSLEHAPPALRRRGRRCESRLDKPRLEIKIPASRPCGQTWSRHNNKVGQSREVFQPCVLLRALGGREERRRHLRGRRREHTARLNHCSVGLRELSLNADCCVVGECTAELLIHIFLKIRRRDTSRLLA